MNRKLQVIIVVALVVLTVTTFLTLRVVMAQSSAVVLIPDTDIFKKPPPADWALYASKSWLMTLEQRLILNVSIPVGAPDYIDRAGREYAITQEWHDQNVMALEAVRAILSTMPETGDLATVLDILTK